MANNGGDQLARGAKSATFGPPANISQARWDAIWADESNSVRKVELQTGQNEIIKSEK
jgi:hypothetical protein